MSEFLDIAISAAKDAEKVLLKHYTPKGVESSQKSDGSPVTIADKEAEQLIVSRIKAAFPDHSMLAEESGTENTRSEYTWIIDPIDGTKNFTRGVPLFGTLIALMKNGEIIVGVSNMPLLNDLMYAEKGSGAFRNGKQIHVSGTKRFKDAYLSSGSLHYFEPHGLVEKLAAIRKDIFQFRLFGDQFAYHLLAQGKIDAVTEGHIKIYDVAALKLIIEEAGGRATEIDGSAVGVDTTTFLATNGHVHEDFLSYFDLETTT